MVYALIVEAQIQSLEAFQNDVSAMVKIACP